MKMHYPCFQTADELTATTAELALDHHWEPAIAHADVDMIAASHAQSQNLEQTLAIDDVAIATAASTAKADNHSGSTTYGQIFELRSLDPKLR